MYVDAAPVVTAPSDPNVMIWRYLDLPKLVSLLDKQALWFARADTLGDPHEGAATPAGFNSRPTLVTSPRGRTVDLSDAYRQMADIRRGFVRHTYISCWHMSASESMAMWSIYAAAGQGVAVRSTFDRLRTSLRTSEPTNIGVVNYIDPSRSVIDERDALSPYVYKRLAYEHERELRAIIQAPPTEGGRLLLDRPSAAGLLIDVDISELVTAVMIAPGQPPWFAEAVGAVVHALAPNIAIQSSDLDVDPVY